MPHQNHIDALPVGQCYSYLIFTVYFKIAGRLHIDKFRAIFSAVVARIACKEK